MSMPDTPPRTPGLDERIADEVFKACAECCSPQWITRETVEAAARRIAALYAGAAPAERGGRYREALEAIAESPAGEADDSWEMRAIARRALAPEQGELTRATDGSYITRDPLDGSALLHSTEVSEQAVGKLRDRIRTDAPPAPGETRETFTVGGVRVRENLSWPTPAAPTSEPANSPSELVGEAARLEG